jgi:hypothetical protein
VEHGELWFGEYHHCFGPSCIGTDLLLNAGQVLVPCFSYSQDPPIHNICVLFSSLLPEKNRLCFVSQLNHG